MKYTFLVFLFVTLINSNVYTQEKISIGLLVPLTGKHANIGKSIIKSTRLAVNQIDNKIIEIIPRDTAADAEKTLDAANELKRLGVKVVIGPVFNQSNKHLGQLKDIIFLSLTNKSKKISDNVINTGINSTSQFNAILKFQKKNDLNKTLFLIPKENFKNEIENGIKNSNIKYKKKYYYDSDPTKLTKQIEKITKYNQRKQNLEDEIIRLEKLEDDKYRKQIEKLKRRDTLGKIGFDSVVISDFDETLKSITTSLLYTDVTTKRVTFITLNQWFDESLLREVSSQNIYFPSINLQNFIKFTKIYEDKFRETPNQLSFLSYDLVGLVYFLVKKNNFIVNSKIFSDKSSFKGKIGIFEIKDSKIEHLLNFYQIKDNDFKKIF